LQGGLTGIPSVPASDLGVQLVLRRALLPLFQNPFLQQPRPRSPVAELVKIAIQSDDDRNRSRPVREIPIHHVRVLVAPKNAKLDAGREIAELGENRDRVGCVAAPVFRQHQQLETGVRWNHIQCPRRYTGQPMQAMPETAMLELARSDEHIVWKGLAPKVGKIEHDQSPPKDRATNSGSLPRPRPATVNSTMSVPPMLRRDGQATREKLLRAALELYTTAGFLGTTTPEIALRAGVAEGTIYRHFTGKEELLNEVYRSSQRWALSLITESEGDRALGVAPRLRRIALRVLEAADRDPATTRMALHFEDGRHLDEQSRVLARQVRDALQQIIASGKADATVRTGPAELWAGVWLAVVGWAAERVIVKEWNPGHPQAIQAVDAAWDAIKA